MGDALNYKILNSMISISEIKAPCVPPEALSLDAINFGPHRLCKQRKGQNKQHNSYL